MVLPLLCRLDEAIDIALTRLGLHVQETRVEEVEALCRGRFGVLRFFGLPVARAGVLALGVAILFCVSGGGGFGWVEGGSPASIFFPACVVELAAAGLMAANSTRGGVGGCAPAEVVAVMEATSGRA